MNPRPGPYQKRGRRLPHLNALSGGMGRGVTVTCLALLGCLTGWTRLGAASAAAKSREQQAWTLLEQYSATQAAQLFRLPDGDEPTSPRARLGLAAALLGSNPRTAQNVDQAAHILQGIIDEKGKSETKAASLYLLARIEQIFRTGHLAQAEHDFQRLTEEYPQDPLADYARVKLALMRLDQLPASSDDADFDRVLATLQEPRTPSARRDFHLVVADFLIERNELRAALAQLLDVRQLGVSSGRDQADLEIQIGTIAARLRHYAMALQAYETVLKRFPQDPRDYMVKDLVKKLRREAAQDD